MFDAGHLHYVFDGGEGAVGFILRQGTGADAIDPLGETGVEFRAARLAGAATRTEPRCDQRDHGDRDRAAHGVARRHHGERNRIAERQSTDAAAALRRGRVNQAALVSECLPA